MFTVMFIKVCIDGVVIVATKSNCKIRMKKNEGPNLFSLKGTRKDHP
jgi:hypothetical protein